MFKTIELGAWYRIRWEGKSIFGKALERHRNSYTFRLVDEKGKARTVKVSRSDICGRLGDHFVAELEATIAPAKRQRAAEPKAVDHVEVPKATKPSRPVSDPPTQIIPPRKASPARRRRKPSKGQRSLFPE